MMTIEQSIRKDANQWGVVGSEYILRVQEDMDGGLKVYLRPSDRGGTTTDFIISGNDIFWVSTNEELINEKRKNNLDKIL